jgi:hypothetical protein
VAAVLLVAIAVTVAVVARPHNNSNPFAGKKAAFGKGDPDAQALIAGHTGNLGGPDSYAAQQLGALAYPATSVKKSQLVKERSAFASLAASRFTTGNAWHLVGPTTSTQPAVLNFFDFQASDYQVSGRVTALAVNPSCNASTCQMWVAAAGGGIWKTGNALATRPTWTFTSGSFGTNAIGALTYSHGTLYAGTGEPNASGDSESGVGIFKSTDGGTTWTRLQGSISTMTARSISSIVVDPRNTSTIYVGTARGVRGVSAVTGGAVSLAPDAAPWGLYKTTDGGKTFNMVWDGNASIRGINHVEMDSHGTIYAAAFQQGIWRSSDGGSTWEQVFATQDPTDNAARTEFALTTLNGHTRIYVGDGGTEIDTAFPPHANTGVYRADSIDTKTSAQLTDGTNNPGFIALTDPNRGTADPTYDYCETQCWYDNYVVSPAGHPNMVYIGGSFDYNLYAYGVNNGRGILFSSDAGNTWHDFTRDSSNPTTGDHPDQHSLVVDPANPLLFFEGSDGGLIRSSGQTADTSSNCPNNFGAFSTTCTELLSEVPTKLTPVNAGLSTLQFQGIATKPTAPGSIIGGTQDNGTWLGSTASSSWSQTIYGDGGVAMFDASDPNLSMNEFYGAATDANFENGDPTKWVITSGPLANSGEGSEFYKPQIADPATSGTAYVGMQSVWRTKDWGGPKANLEANCPEFTTSFAQTGCGDWKPLGDPSGNGGPNSPSDLTGSAFGADRTGGDVVALARTKQNTNTLWAATSAGRVFISKNANGPAGSATFIRLDTGSPAAPGRFVSGIVLNAQNSNEAWVSYTGYNENTPSTPGHVFRVDYNPTTRTATFTDVDNNNGPLGDLPVTSITRDVHGTLYVGTDFGVLSNSNGWKFIGSGMPKVEITDLTISSANVLFAATHGRGIWKMALN